MDDRWRDTYHSTHVDPRWGRICVTWNPGDAGTVVSLHVHRSSRTRHLVVVLGVGRASMALHILRRRSFRG